MLCSDACLAHSYGPGGPYAKNSFCQDGGEDSTGATCAYGTDCTDCGRAQPQPLPPQPQPQPQLPTQHESHNCQAALQIATSLAALATSALAAALTLSAATFALTAGTTAAPTPTPTLSATTIARPATALTHAAAAVAFLTAAAAACVASNHIAYAVHRRVPSPCVWAWRPLRK